MHARQEVGDRENAAGAGEAQDLDAERREGGEIGEAEETEKELPGTREGQREGAAAAAFTFAGTGNTR